MRLWNISYPQEDGDGDFSYDAGTELPPIKSSSSSGSEGESSSSDFEHPYPLLAKKAPPKAPANVVMRKQSTSEDEPQFPVSMGRAGR